MGVDVAYLLGREAAVQKRAANGAGRTLGERLGNVTGVGGHAEADNLGDWPRAARQRGLERLEHQHGCAFAENHARRDRAKKGGRCPG